MAPHWLRFEWELLFLFLVPITAIVPSIGLNDCPRCLNFDCAHNGVPGEVRKAYREAAPSTR
jgi:hypothetical protein